MSKKYSYAHSKYARGGGRLYSPYKTCFINKQILFSIIALFLVFVVGVTFSALNTHNIHNEPLGALSSSTTYYKNGSSFYTLSSTQQHYHCTNSSHSGSNDYTTSSVSGTCYSYKRCSSCGGDWSGCSCTVSCSNCGGSGEIGTTCSFCGGKGYVTCTDCNGKGYLTFTESCDDCGGSGDCPSCGGDGYTTGGWTGSTKYGCGSCGGSGGGVWGSAFVAGSGNCSSCGGSGRVSWTETCPCEGVGGPNVDCEECSGGKVYSSCSSCGGDGEVYSSYSTRNVSHSISTYYKQYNYSNIDTGGTATSQSAYSTATGYTITFNSNGGSGSMSNQYFLHGHSQAINSNAYSRSGYEFLGWSTSSGATSATYSNNQAVTSITTGSSATLYAVWRALNYKVYYDVSGYQNKVGTLAGGFENTGWSGTYDTAHVRSGSYALKITATTSNVEVVVFTSSPIAIDSSTKTHIYYFQYWGYQETALSNGTTQIYWPEEEPSFGSIKLGPAGQWNKYSFYGTRSSNALSGSKNVRIDFDNRSEAGTIWFDDFIMLDLTETFGAGNEPSKEWCDLNIVPGAFSQVITYNASTALTKKPTTHTATGYTFKGWSTSPRTTTQQSVNYTDGQSVNNIASAGGSVTLYGVWEQNKFNVTVDVGANGTVTPTSASVGWGDDYNFVIKANDKYKIEYLFLDGEQVNYNPNDLNYVTEYTYTLKDVRKAHTIKVTFTEIVKLIIDVQNPEYTNSCYIFKSDYDPTTTTTETVVFYVKEFPGFKFTGWANRKGEIVSTNPFQTFEFVKDDEYRFLAVFEPMPVRPYYSINHVADLLAFINTANTLGDAIYGVPVYLNCDIDLTNNDLFTMYGYTEFPHLLTYTGYIEYNGYSITKDGKYFDLKTGNLTDTPQSSSGIL